MPSCALLTFHASCWSKSVCVRCCRALAERCFSVPRAEKEKRRKEIMVGLGCAFQHECLGAYAYKRRSCISTYSCPAQALNAFNFHIPWHDTRGQSNVNSTHQEPAEALR